MDDVRCTPGEWVEVECVLLEPADRAANLPADTAQQQMLAFVNGFAQAGAALGEEATVETMTGRLVTGRLSEINPGYFHTFGRPPTELIGVGRDLRARVAAYRAGDSAEGGDAR
jgi:2-amino-4-ketopentanoate thiolase alpha subunit